MDKKLILTNNEIEKDIRHALKNPPYESEKSYRRKPFIIIAAFILVVILAIIWPVVVLATIFVFFDWSAHLALALEILPGKQKDCVKRLSNYSGDS